MAIMCDECKCSIYLETNADGTKQYGGCENECACCNIVAPGLELRARQILATTDEDRDEGDDETNPIIFAESGPNRFSVMTLFFEDKPGGANDGVTIQEDLELNEITIKYFTEAYADTIELSSGPVYEWALNYYKENF